MDKRMKVCLLIVIGLAPGVLTLMNAEAVSISVFVYGYVKDSVTDLPVPQTKVTVSMPAGVGHTYTSQSGYYSIRVTTIEPGPLTVKVRAEKWGYYTQTKSFSSSGGSYRKDFSFVDRGKRIAVFFYDNDACTSAQIEDYSTKMADRGYQIIKHKQPSNWVSDMNDLDAMESTYDRVLIFVGAHGNYISSSDLSYAVLKKWWIFEWRMYSDDLRAEVADLESERITVVVRACRSGDFKDELASLSGVTVLSSCKETESSDSAFSFLFFDEFGLFGNTISGTYNYICDHVTYHPQIDYGAQSYTYA